jgi:hypothetical protein
MDIKDESFSISYFLKNNGQAFGIISFIGVKAD